MTVTEMNKYFSVVINKPNDMTGCIPFTQKDFANILNVMYPFYALCIHDSDLDDDGIPKTLHMHICIFRGHRCRILTLINELHSWTGYPTNCITVEVPKCWNRSIRYLLHLDNPEKAPYSMLELFTNNEAEVDNAMRSLVDIITYDHIERVCYDNVLLPNIIKALGMDNYNRYWRIVKAILDEPTFRLIQQTRREKILKVERESQIQRECLEEVLNNGK